MTTSCEHSRRTVCPVKTAVLWRCEECGHEGVTYDDIEIAPWQKTLADGLMIVALSFIGTALVCAWMAL